MRQGACKIVNLCYCRHMTAIYSTPSFSRRLPSPALAHRVSVPRPTFALSLSIRRHDRGTLACLGEAR